MPWLHGLYRLNNDLVVRSHDSEMSAVELRASSIDFLKTLASSLKRWNICRKMATVP